MRLPVNHILPLAALILLGAGAAAARDRDGGTPMPATGPAADYPVVVGQPFTIDGTVWTPTDQLNYDAVGQTVVDGGDLAGVSGAHKTLPLPSYVEVTSLDSGRTILVRLERRGPMVNDALVELSPEAAAQLGLAPGHRSPVRVRRVNPPEQERSILRGGGRAPERMETPEGLLKVLRRKLAEQAPLSPPSASPPAMPATEPAPPAPLAKAPQSRKAPATVPALAGAVQPPALSAPAPQAEASQAPAQPAPPPRAKAPARKGSLVVQVAAFSVEPNARKVAGQLGGGVSQAGKYWRVRLGPFASRADAAPALEKAKAAGYSDARIQSAD